MNVISDIRARLITLKMMKALALLSIVYNVLNAQLTAGSIIAVYFGAILFLVANDYIRNRFFIHKKKYWYYFSFIISVSIVGYFGYHFQSFGTEVYNIMLLIELIVMNSKLKITAILYDFAVYLISHGVGTRLREFVYIEGIFTSFFWTLFIIFLFRSAVIEKKRVEKLNNELQEANQTLKEYSAMIEELAIAKERAEIAQELHDSIGHSLVALKMNLEYAENVVEMKPEKAKEVISKAQELSKDCMVNLRKAVSLLKEEHAVESLRDAVCELFTSFNESSHIKLKLQMEDAVEMISPDLKNCIFKTVREAVTNGIKHGNATVFWVTLLKKSGQIIFKIENNGLACREIIKSNGLNGMKVRVDFFGGDVSFSSKQDFGFVVEGSIPENAKASAKEGGTL